MKDFERDLILFIDFFLGSVSVSGEEQVYFFLSSLEALLENLASKFSLFGRV